MRKPRSKGADARTVNINVKVTSAQKAKLQKEADLTKKTLSSYVLFKLSDGPLHEKMLQSHIKQIKIDALSMELKKFERQINQVFFDRHKDRELLFPISTGFNSVIVKEKQDVVNAYMKGYDSYCFLLDKLKNDYPEVYKKIIDKCTTLEMKKRATGKTKSPN